MCWSLHPKGPFSIEAHPYVNLSKEGADLIRSGIDLPLVLLIYITCADPYTLKDPSVFRLIPMLI